MHAFPTSIIRCGASRALITDCIFLSMYIVPMLATLLVPCEGRSSCNFFITLPTYPLDLSFFPRVQLYIPLQDLQYSVPPMVYVSDKSSSLTL